MLQLTSNKQIKESGKSMERIVAFAIVTHMFSILQNIFIVVVVAIHMIYAQLIYLVFFSAIYRILTSNNMK